PLLFRAVRLPTELSLDVAQLADQVPDAKHFIHAHQGADLMASRTLANPLPAGLHVPPHVGIGRRLELTHLTCHRSSLLCSAALGIWILERSPGILPLRKAGLHQKRRPKQLQSAENRKGTLHELLPVPGHLLAKAPG